MDRTDYLKNYYIKNKERIKLRDANRYKEKRDILLEKTSKYYFNNIEKYKNYRIVNKVKSDSYFKQYYLDKKISKNYLKRYNITIEDYEYLFNKQEGCCKGCEKHQSEFKSRFAVDHCHISGKIRGLLCMKCNCALGLIHDNKKTLTNLIKYLDQ